MAGHPKLPSNEPDRSGGQTKRHRAESHLGFGPLGKSVVQSLPIGIVAFDTDLRIIEANSQAGKLIDIGNRIDESLSKGCENLKKPRPDWTQQLKSSLSTGKTSRFDDVGYTQNGGTKLLRITCMPSAKAEKDIAGTVIIEDISEKLVLHRQLADTERLATIGRLASKVAHELNNPMDGILRYINLTMRVIEQENLEKPKEYLTHCREGLMRMVQIVSELLEFSRSTYAPLEYVNIEHLIEDAIKTMGSRVESFNVRLLRNYSPNIPQIKSGNLFQVFCNLTKNALDAMPDGGELKISTRLATDNTAIVEFRDTGSGFAPENAEAIFEPFFTTREKGKGTGLGLAICRDIIETYHGQITAENAPDGGSIFTVYLPVKSNS